MDPVNLSLKVPAIEKLIDYGASGVGAIAGPLLAPWKASREGKARLIAAEADAQVRQIQAGADASALNIIAEAQSEARAYLLPADADVHATLDITPQDISQSFEFQGRKRLTNVRSVLEDAADELGDKEVTDHEPDPDWTARLFDCVQDVSSEDMQKIWAKILAGEVESPGRTSLRTLETLRNMTKQDADMFRNVCDFVFSNDFVFYNDSVKNIVSFNFNTLFHLQDCGLINVGPNLAKQFAGGSGTEIFFLYHEGALMVTKGLDAKDLITIPEVLLTAPGKELSRFAQCTLQLEYLQAFSKFLKSKDWDLFYLESVVPLPDGSIHYANRIPIEPQPDQAGGATP